jgi:hypothetical protein
MDTVSVATTRSNLFNKLESLDNEAYNIDMKVS